MQNEQSKVSKLKVEVTKMIDESDWSDFVTQTYGRPYRFQQQDGCKERGTYHLTVPDKFDYDKYGSDTIPETTSTNKMQVKFKAWIDRNPSQILKDKEGQLGSEPWYIELWWERNFYPAIESVANDLHSKGLLEAGEYVINIDW